MAITNTQKKDHRSRKNAASREAWLRDKRKNRPKQVYMQDEFGVYGWAKLPVKGS